MIDSPETVCIFIDKPVGMTSADVVHALKKKYPHIKIGHGGTLDPFAQGLLPIFFGKWTRLSSLFSLGDKRYIGRLKLGEQTDTGDHTGQVVKSHKPMPVHDWNLHLIQKKLHGSVDLPIPIYSALKIDGKPMHELARKGLLQEPVRFRESLIHSLSLVYNPKNSEILIDVCCSHGTYIRSLAEKIAKELGQVGHLVMLKRMGYGHKSQMFDWPIMTLDQALSSPNFCLKLDDLQNVIVSYSLPSQSAQQIFRGQKNHLAFRYTGWFLIKNFMRDFGAVYVRNGKIEQRIIIENPKVTLPQEMGECAKVRTQPTNKTWAQDWLAD